MEYTKLPSFTAWWDDVCDDYGSNSHQFPVTRILMPAKYPNWTFVTNDFRYSIRLPEAFGNSMMSYSTHVERLLQSGEDIEEQIELVAICVWVQRGKPQLHALREPLRKLTQVQLDTGYWAYPVNRGAFYDLETVRSTSDSFTPSSVFTDQFSAAFNLTEQSVAVSPVTPTKTRKASRTSPK